MEPVAELLEDLQVYWLAYGHAFVLPALAALIFLGAGAEIIRRIVRHIHRRREARDAHWIDGAGLPSAR